MQKVPVDKILIQPTVQYQWLLQHGSIEFSLASDLLHQFECLWQLYRESQPCKPNLFLQQTKLDPFDLVNNDVLFALFTGASYAIVQNPTFRILVSQYHMTWEMDR